MEQLKEQHAAEESAAIAQASNPQAQQKLHYFMWGLAGYNRVASRYGVEVRDPWADPLVVEFFMRLPIEQKVKNGWTKYLVRKSFQRDLSPEVLWRRDKDHLGWKFSQRVMLESKGMIAELMDREIELLQEYVDLGAARALHSTWQSSDDNAARGRLV